MSFLEQELKLVVEGDDKLDLLSLQWLVALADAELETDQLISTYYDTPDQYLSKLKVGLRLRKKGSQWFQTVKTAGKVKEGLHQRQEWEDELANEQWNLDNLKQTPLADIIDDVEIWSTLQPIFTTDFIRETLQLTLADCTQIELAYDRGEVRAGDLRSTIHEVELELKSGSVENLEQIATRLQEEFRLTPSDCSKAKLGYQLASLSGS